MQAELRSYEHLAALPDVTTQETPEAVLTELSTTRAFRSMALGAGDETIRATNWHREKLRREGVTLLWLEGLDALERFRELAPDAYSFRDGLVLVSGVPVFRVETPTEERAELKLAHRRYDRAKSSWERLEAGGEYVEQLRAAGRNDDALKAAQSLRSTLQVCMDGPPSWTSQWLLAAGRICAALTNGDAWADAFAIVGKARFLAVVVEPEAQARYAYLLSVTPDPCSVSDADSVFKAAGIVTNLPLLFRGVLPDMRRDQAQIARARGRFLEAHRLLEDARQRANNLFNQMLANVEIAGVALDLGYSEEAFLRLRDVWNEAVHTNYFSAVELLARVHIQHDENAAAQRLLESPGIPCDMTAVYRLLSLRVMLATCSGQSDDILTTLEKIVTSPPPYRDGVIYQTSQGIVHLLRSFHEAERLDPSRLPRWDHLLVVAQNLLLSIGESDLPWYRVLMPALRADLLSLRPDRRADAITLYRESWDLARKRYPEAAADVAVRFIDALLDADELTDLPALLDAATALAVARERLNDQMALVVRRLLYGVRTGTSSTSLDVFRKQLDTLFAESGSLVLKANTLLTLARRLPPTATTPDALVIVDESRRVFAELGAPDGNALCAERAGEIALARGDRALARQRFQDALRRRRTYGLALRIPRLERLLASASDDAPSA